MTDIAAVLLLVLCIHPSFWGVGGCAAAGLILWYSTVVKSAGDSPAFRKISLVLFMDGIALIGVFWNVLLPALVKRDIHWANINLIWCIAVLISCFMMIYALSLKRYWFLFAVI